MKKSTNCLKLKCGQSRKLLCDVGTDPMPEVSKMTIGCGVQTTNGENVGEIVQQKSPTRVTKLGSPVSLSSRN